MKEDQEIGVSTAAARKGIKLSALLYLLKQGRGPSYRMVDGRRLFRESEIEAWKPEWHLRGRKKA